MKNEKPTVALIFGGRGFEHEVSVEGAKFLYPNISPLCFNKIPIYISRSGEWRISADAEVTPEILCSGKCKSVSVSPAVHNGWGGLIGDMGFTRIDAAFPLLHGDFGEDGVIAGTLENAKIPYVGCDAATSAVLSDKAYTKIIAERLGIPTAKWIYSVNESPSDALERVEESLSYPLFIKPSRLGSSVGAGAVLCREDFLSAFERAHALGSGRVLIESLVTVKKELECAYFGAGGKELFTSVGEISYDGGFYDYESKYSKDSGALVLDGASISAATAHLVRDLSRRLVSYLGVRELSRVDFFLTDSGEILFNEINTVPGFTQSSLYPRLLSRSGIEPEEALTAFFKAAIKRGA